jgi:SsrA-binding protein
MILASISLMKLLLLLAIVANSTAFILPSSKSSFRLANLKAAKKNKNVGKSPIIATNRQARRDYEVLNTYVAGISLLGSEVKAIRDGKMNIRDGFVRPNKTDRGLSLYNTFIGKLTNSEFFNHEERRARQLLLRKEECRKLRKEVENQGLTIVPLKAFFTEKNLIKIEIALCRGKNVRDKRNDIKDREAKRDNERMMKSFRVG